MQELYDAVKRVCPNAFSANQGGQNPIMGAISPLDRNEQKTRWVALIAYAAATAYTRDLPETDDWTLIKRAFASIEQQGFIDFEDYYTEEALAEKAEEAERQAAHQRYLAEKAQRSQRYTERQKTLVLTDEQKAKVAAKDFKFTKVGDRITSMARYIPVDPKLMFRYNMFGAHWGRGSDSDIVNSWIRNGVVEVVRYHDDPLAAVLRQGPNAKRFAKEHNFKFGGSTGENWIHRAHREIDQQTGENIPFKVRKGDFHPDNVAKPPGWKPLRLRDDE